jgi:hypothetical protein
MLNDEVDIYSRLEFELFAFGIIPTSSSLPLLKDREVVYVNLLPLRPPTPFSLRGLAPSRAPGSLVAEVRRPGTGLPYEVVYSENRHPPEGLQGSTSDPLGATDDVGKRRKGSRFKEHMSDISGSHRYRSSSVGEIDVSHVKGKERQSSPNTKVWYKESGDGSNGRKADDPDAFDGDTLYYVALMLG